jgi:hypothetical protein
MMIIEYLGFGEKGYLNSKVLMCLVLKLRC